MACGRDIELVFGGAPQSLCRVDEHGWLGLSGEPAAADVNMAYVAGSAPVSLVDEYVGVIMDNGLNAILIVDEDASHLSEHAATLGPVAVGNVPVMLWENKPAPQPKGDFVVRLATRDDMPTVMELVSSAFSLDEAMVKRVCPPELADVDGLGFWLAFDGDEPVGTGTFVRTADHCGIYNMGTPAAGPRRGIGRAVLESAIAHYVADGVTGFTLEATEAGFHLYEQVGFEVIATPTVLLVGESTQFPG